MSGVESWWRQLALSQTETSASWAPLSGQLPFSDPDGAMRAYDSDAKHQLVHANTARAQSRVDEINIQGGNVRSGDDALHAKTGGQRAQSCGV